MLIHIALAGLVLFALVVWFYGLEAAGDRHVIFVVLVITLLVEALLAGPASEVPLGILRPQLLQQDFRPPDAVIVAALAARVLAMRPRRMSPVTGPWAAFLCMYIAGVVVGLLYGIAPTEVLFQGKAAFYIIGGAVIASGLDVDRLNANVGRLGVVLAAIVPVALVVGALDLDFSFSTPVQRFNRLGRLSNDTVTLLTMVGIVVILTEAVRRRQRLVVGIAGLVLLLAPAAGQQRASYLVVLAVVIALGMLSFGTTWKRRASVTGVEMGLVAAALMGLVIAGFLLTSSPGVIVGPVENAFGGAAEERSAASRVSLIDQAIAKIGESPLIGSGVGTKVIRQAELSNREVAAAAHNVFLDVGMRIGLIGLALFLAALWVTGSQGMRVWREARDNETAAVAAAGVIIVLAVVTKGMVEPALDKFRLSLSLGIGVGMVMAAVRRHDDEVDARPPRQRAVVPRLDRGPGGQPR